MALPTTISARQLSSSAEQGLEDLGSREEEDGCEARRLQDLQDSCEARRLQGELQELQEQADFEALQAKYGFVDMVRGRGRERGRRGRHSWPRAFELCGCRLRC